MRQRRKLRGRPTGTPTARAPIAARQTGQEHPTVDARGACGLQVRFAPAMPRVTFITFAGERHVVIVPTGTTLMRAATDHGVPGIDGDCGGQCACATCHCFVESPWAAQLGERSARESEMLEFVVEPRP